MFVKGNFYKIIGLLLSTVYLAACSHTVDFRSSRFAVPHVKENQWQGSVTFGVADSTKITLISDRESNPPGRTISVNQDVSYESLIETLFTFDKYGILFDITLFPQVEFFGDDQGLYGLRWQFLGNGSATNVFVASLQGGIGSFTESTGSELDATPDLAKSDISTTETGLSVGYKWDKAIGYVSYLQDKHTAKSTVTNTHGTFGSYTDKGNHNIISVGISSHSSAFMFGVEYNLLDIAWNGLPSEKQESFGFRAGYSW